MCQYEQYMQRFDYIINSINETNEYGATIEFCRGDYTFTIDRYETDTVVLLFNATCIEQIIKNVVDHFGLHGEVKLYQEF